MHLTLLLLVYSLLFQSTQRRISPKHLACWEIGSQTHHAAQNPRVFLLKGNNSWNNEANKLRAGGRIHRYPSALPYILQIPLSSKFLPALGAGIFFFPYTENE